MCCMDCCMLVLQEIYTKGCFLYTATLTIILFMAREVSLDCYHLTTEQQHQNFMNHSLHCRYTSALYSDKIIQ